MSGQEVDDGGAREGGAFAEIQMRQFRGARDGAECGIRDARMSHVEVC
jgi:hypothetical protein